MTVQDLYDVISDISTQDVKLYFVTRKTKENITKKMRAKDKYLFRVYQIDCDDELRETILSASKEQLKATIDKNFDLVDYDILSDETENLFTYSIKNKVFSFSDVVTNQLLSTNIEKVKNKKILMYHGDKDDVVDVNVSIKTYEKLKDGNAKDVELKIINNDNHFLTSHAFKDQYIYEWLEKKVKEK